MSESRCINCLKKIDAGIACPHCGALQQADENYPYAMRPNTILHGKYLIGRVLGQGGFGITYVGFDLALEMKVAVKEYFPQGLAGRSGSSSQLVWNKTQLEAGQAEQGVKAFLKEARQMAKLDSLPAIVRVRDTFPDNGTAYIVMDFVEGETMKTRLMKTGPMKFEHCIAFLEPLMQSLDSMHANELIHRDISPDNIMVQPDGTPCLLDLGAAKDLSGNSSLSTQMVMKKGFSPLEQYTTGGNIGPWTDVYALSATIYYAVTGRLVPNVMDRAFGQCALNFALSDGTLLPPSVQAVLQEGLAIQPGDRIQSIGELEKRLRQAAEDSDRKAGTFPDRSDADDTRDSANRNDTEETDNTTETRDRVDAAETRDSNAASNATDTADTTTVTARTDAADTKEPKDKSADLKEPQKTQSGKSKKKAGLIAIAAAAVVVVIGIAVAVGGNNGSGTTVSDTDEGEEETLVYASGALMADEYNSDDDVHYVLGSSYEREDIYTITFVDSIEGNSTAWDVSAAGDGSVIAWVETNGSGYDLYIGGDGGVDLTDGCKLFCYYTNVEEINFNSCVYTSNVSNMRSMFYGCSSLSSLDLSTFDTTNVTDMICMFYGCNSLSSLDLSGFDTTSVTVMRGMFGECSSLSSLDISGFDTSNVISMESMFFCCDSLTSLDLSSFDTTNVTTMKYMFYNCSSLISLNLSSFDTSAVTDMSYMFYYCSSLTSLDCGNFAVGSLTDATDMFDGCSSSAVNAVLYGIANDQGVTESGNVMMADAYDTEEDVHYVLGSSYEREDIYTITFVDSIEGNSTAWDVSAAGDGSVMAWVVTNGSGYDLYIGGDGGVDLTSGYHLFHGYTNVEEIDFNSCIYTGDVTNMIDMFTGCDSLNSLDLSGFDTSNVTGMEGMFYGCDSLSSLDLSSFDTSNVTNMTYMFSACDSLSSLDLSSFDTSNVTSMKCMFAYSGLTSLDLSNFDTSNVTSMTYMFHDCKSLSSLDLSGFDTSNVTSMYRMFYGCDSLSSLDLSGFDTSNVTSMYGMFENCRSLSSLDLSGFDTSNVTDIGSDMQYMFIGCSISAEEAGLN